ncbi:MAG: DUF805 domain-containing protein [Prevotella sp.]|nr:DUF805 domain-containing protein [Prevotella sp.]
MGSITVPADYWCNKGKGTITTYIMDFNTAVHICLKEKYASFSGRARRSEYWFFMLFYMIVVLGTSVIGGIISETLGTLLYAVSTLALICPAISVMVRRLHDTGKSGWWYWIALVPVIGGIYLLILMLKDSGADNEYGQNPKDLLKG